MKKLNRKGFTLIELLAVIVVLAIIIVVTIPSVISSMNSAKTSQLKNAAGTVQEWLQKNYDIATVGGGVGTPDAAYTSANLTFTTTGNTDISSILGSAGLTNTTGLTGTAKLNGTKICVTLTAGETSQFYVANEESHSASAGC